MTLSAATLFFTWLFLQKRKPWSALFIFSVGAWLFLFCSFTLIDMMLGLAILAIVLVIAEVVGEWA